MLAFQLACLTMPQESLFQSIYSLVLKHLGGSLTISLHALKRRHPLLKTREKDLEIECKSMSYPLHYKSGLRTPQPLHDFGARRLKRYVL